MSTGDVIQDVVGVLTIIGIVTGFATWLFRRLNKSRQREIDERIAAADKRREREQEQGTPVERILQKQVDELKQELADVRAQHRQEIDDLRAEHDREITDLRRQWLSDTEALRAQITEAYRTRPNAAGGTP